LLTCYVYSTKIGEISDISKCFENFVSQALGVLTRIYAAELRDDKAFTLFTEKLYEYGYFYCRWGYLLPDRRELPEEGDKVVFIHKQDKAASLYLMHLVATNKHAESSFNIPEEELEMTDDCLPCVLTNVKGPITCTDSELTFLDDEDISDCRPEGLLSDYAVDRL